MTVRPASVGTTPLAHPSKSWVDGTADVVETTLSEPGRADVSGNRPRSLPLKSTDSSAAYAQRLHGTKEWNPPNAIDQYARIRHRRLRASVINAGFAEQIPNRRTRRCNAAGSCANAMLSTRRMRPAKA